MGAEMNIMVDVMEDSRCLDQCAKTVSHKSLCSSSSERGTRFLEIASAGAGVETSHSVREYAPSTELPTKAAGMIIPDISRRPFTPAQRSSNRISVRDSDLEDALSLAEKQKRVSLTFGKNAKTSRAFPSRLHPRSESTGGKWGMGAEMDIMVDVMMEDSHYLDQCAKTISHKSRCSSSPERGTRFLEIACAGVDISPSGRDSAPFTELPSRALVQDMVLFDEFMDDGEGVAAKSTFSLLRRAHEEAAQHQIDLV